jgi:thiol-disulfide isomerase/thioredoxin
MNKFLVLTGMLSASFLLVACIQNPGGPTSDNNSAANNPPIAGTQPAGSDIPVDAADNPLPEGVPVPPALEENNNEQKSEESLEMLAYLESSAEEFNELRGEEPVVAFFHANWCPTCRAMEKEILEDPTQFPSGTKILKLDYDEETELKNELGVKIQSTVIVFDAAGNEIYTATDPAFDDFIAAIEKSMEA